jgi:hypothetical protein
MLSDSIFRYDKAMGTWRYISSSGLARKSPISMGSQGSTLLIGTWHSGMYRSPDSGRTWTVALDSAAAGGVHDFAEAGDYAFAATDSGVAGSERGGAWSLMNQGLPVVRNQPIRANALLAQGGILFAGFDRFGIWKLDLGISGIANREGTPERRAAKRWTRVSGGIGFGDGAGKPFRDAAGKALDRPAR